MSIFCWVLFGFLASGVAGFFMWGYPGEKYRPIGLLAAVGFAPLVALIVPSFVFHWAVGLGALLFTSLCLGGFVYSVGGFAYPVSKNPGWAAFTEVAAIAASAVLTIFVLLPLVSDRIGPESVEPFQGIDAQAVRERFSEISDSFDAFDASARDNWLAIDTAAQAIILQIEEQNQELTRLQEEADVLRAEVDLLRTASEMPAEQVDALLEMMRNEAKTQLLWTILVGLGTAIGGTGVGILGRSIVKRSTS